MVGGWCMAKRIITKASKTRLIVFGGLCVAVISYFIINTFSMLLNIKKLSSEQQTLQSNLVQLQEDEVNLTKELSKLKNDEYKARYAREYFLYSKENGEYIFSNILDDAWTAVCTPCGFSTLPEPKKPAKWKTHLRLLRQFLSTCRA